jgi:peptidoglycan hydrolase CwlO-like protein
VSDVVSPPTARFTFAGRSAGYALLQFLVVVLVGLVATSVVLVARPVGAAQVSDLQARAAQLSASMIREQLEVATEQQQSYAATQKVDDDAALIAQTQRQLTEGQRTLRADRVRLRNEAISAYIESGFSPAATQVFQSQKNALLEVEYHDVAFGDTQVTLAQIHTAQSEVLASQNRLEQQEADDQNEQARAAQALSQAQTTQSQLASEQSQVNSQLSAAIAQQQAAEAAQAVAARAAVQAATIAVIATPTPTPALTASSSGAPSAVGVGATVDPALPPFLACVVQVESGGDYGAVSANGTYMGAFQFLQSTWNQAAQLAGLPGLVGVAPNTASKADQDTLAIALYRADGEQPWDDSCQS